MRPLRSVSFAPLLVSFAAGCSSGAVEADLGSATGGEALGSGGLGASGGLVGSGGAETSGGALSSGGSGAAVASGGTASTGGTASGGDAGTGGATTVCADAYPFDDGYSCAEQAAWGKCNEGWMADACDITCGRCVPDSGSGGTAGGGGSGGGGTTDCGHTPIDPSATPQAKKLLCYLYEIYGKKVLSGQQETSWSNPEGDMQWYQDHFGHYPAVLGGDYLYPSGTSSRAISYFNAGGIVMIRYHMGAPPLADTYENSMKSSNLGAVLTPGTSESNSFYSKLDYAAAELKKLADANVAVLFAPFHEVQPNGWFWWSKGSGSEFISLWKKMQTYLMNDKGLHNIVWLLPFSGSPDGSYSPGKSFYDIAGPDTYGTSPPFASLYQTSKNIIGSEVPIPLHETGKIPNPETMFPSTAPWVLFSVWAGYQVSNNDYSAVEASYASSYTLTRDELPNLK